MGQTAVFIQALLNDFVGKRERILVEYETVIGLEVHAQLLTESKIFCGCPVTFGGEPNSYTCPVCLGMPGVLPVLNKKAVALGLKIALAINCDIAPYSQFARKNYFYPDLPKGYQISQFEFPLAKGGFIEIETEGKTKKIGITRIHMEEDAGKLLHELGGVSASSSYVDLNRTGIPLIEIVSEPEISSPEEASQYLQSLRSILQYLDVCNGNMEEGSLRCDANVSIRLRGEKALGTRTELKNMNSFRFVKLALEYEVERQKKLAQEGGKVVQETRLWDSARSVTLPMRGKEESHDYRYFPDPDLVPIVVDQDWIQKIGNGIQELPRTKKERFIREYQIPEYDARILTISKTLADYFENCVRQYPHPKKVSNWVMGEVMRILKTDEITIDKFPVTPRHLSGMLKMIDEGTISGKIAKRVFEIMCRTGKMPAEIVEEEGLVQVSDTEKIIKIIDEVLAGNPEQVEYYHQGKEKLFGFFVGQIMKAARGKANPQVVNQLLKERLQGGNGENH